ncbi:Protein PHLOEM PROTEIN 2-LIKE A1 [Morella rubra]|uniref:Protein PHLOEM PROTEIN 2-LIKE A1 n=1 Tax=Morella rubra TaxID=262757 RepID=A0A6A1VKY7_9ROSI|nr:Protein PHLOEM PROTEIN 2-LIKE A1 [Morella rubra]
MGKEMMKKEATDLGKNALSEEFLEHKKKKKWTDKKTGYTCFALYARSLYVTWGGKENWTWDCFKETSEENIEVAKLSHVCWLDVRGKLSMSDLSPEVVYEIVYVVKLTNNASGWELPIMLQLSLPDGRVQQRQVSLLEKPRKQWIELNVGSFQSTKGEPGEVGFEIHEHEGHWKNGLIISGAILRPKHEMTLHVTQ